MKKPRIAFVVQRYGTDVSGGAESHCRLVVERMSKFWEIEVLTSCARDYVKRFENEYPDGKQLVNGIVVHRFKIDYLRSDDNTFSELDRKVLARKSSHEEDMLWLKEIGPYCSELISYVLKFKHQYDTFIFFGYLYASTTLILPLVREKAYLVPTSHDEPPIYAQFYDNFFSLPKALIVNTKEELSFLQKRTSYQTSPAIEVGVGIEAPIGVFPEAFKQNYQIFGKYILYVGRIQEQKGCRELFDYYLSLPDGVRSKCPLVLIGKSAMTIPNDANIISVGFVNDQMKFNAMAAAELVIMPSKFESLNMVILESWQCNTPVLVNGQCDVLKAHCKRSNGGLWYDNYDEFEICLELMLTNKRLSAEMATNGKNYVENNYNWHRIESKYLELVKNNAGNSKMTGVPESTIQASSKRCSVKKGLVGIWNSLKNILGKTPGKNHHKQSRPVCFDFLAYPYVLPKGETEQSVFAYLSSFHLENAPRKELDEYLKADFKRFLYTLDMIPPGTGKLLEIGANPYFLSMLLEKYTNYQLYYANFFGHGLNRRSIQHMVDEKGKKIGFQFWNFNIEDDDIPFEENYFDIVLFCEVIEHLIRDPMRALLNIKNILKHNGHLILSTPNIGRLENVAKIIAGTNIYDPYSSHGLYGRHNREYNPHELHQLLSQLGFDIEIMFTSDVHSNNSNEFFSVKKFIKLVKNRKLDLGQYIFVSAINNKSANTKKPEWLYRSYTQEDILSQNT